MLIFYENLVSIFILRLKAGKLQGMNPLHIFKVNPTAIASGMTMLDAQDAVTNYNPALHEAPIVIGHPKLDDPAFGWIESLSLAGKTVLAMPKQVVTEFADWVDKGLYKKISASFYGKTNPNNPTPGHAYLKHVGFLGATPPKIKGLPDSSFSEDDGEILTIEFSDSDFSDYADELNIDLWSSLRDWLIEQHGVEAVDKIIPPWKVTSMREVVMRPDPQPIPVNNYSETPMPPTEAELTAREQAIALRERQATLKEQELQFSEALDGVIKEGRVLAAEKQSHLKRLKMLAAIPADSVVDFAEGKTDYSPTAEYLAELKQRPVVVNFSEISGGEVPEQTSDPNKIATAIKAEIKAAKNDGETLSFAEAQARVQAKQNGGAK